MAVSKTERAGLRTWIEVDREAIRRNFDVFKKLIPKKTKLMAVVKSNAYGHSLVDFSIEMERLRADFLGVDSMTEARALRREGVKLPILVLGYTMPELFREAAENGVSLTVSTFETLDAIVKTALPKPLKIHLKVDTGMHRQGFLAGDVPAVLLRIKDKGERVETEGLFTHFASAKNPSFPHDTREQIAEFKRWISAFREAGRSPIAHACATAGAMLFPEAHFDMVRIGMGLYGLWPAKEVEAYMRGRMTLAPALRWKSIITETKRLPAGSRIGYDLTEPLSRDSVVAVVPVGYWHGYPRALSSIGHVVVGTKEAKIIGRVSMDMIVVDVTGIKGIRTGDEVVVIDSNPDSKASVENLSVLLDASWYETITRINPLIKRIYNSR